MKPSVYRHLKTATLFLLLTLLLPAPAASQNQKNFLWEIRSKTGIVYLLGSIHYMKQDAYPLSRKIEDAFERSKILAVEANIADPSSIDIFTFAEKAVYQGDDSLERHVSRETYELLRKELQALGLPIELMNKQKPWFLAMTLESLGLINAGYSPLHGIDYHFLSRAGTKQIAELESIDFQLNLFMGLSDYEQEMLLLHTLKVQGDLPREIDGIVRAWKAGDAPAMEKAIFQGMIPDSGMSSLYEKFLYARNRNMASRIEDFLRKGETVFVVVGAGHLVGGKGIIALLKGQGYSIRQL